MPRPFPAHPFPEPGRPVGADAVGARVVVRRRIPGGGHGDVLGRLERYRADVLAVRRSDGTLVEVALRDVQAAKVVPPRTTRRAVRELETAAAPAWPGLEQERLGGWLLRAGAGFTGRANSVLPLDDPDRPLDDAVAAVEHWYAERGLVPRAALPDRVGADLDVALAHRGWPAYNPSLVLVASVPAPPPGAASRPVQVSAEPDAGWLAGYHYRGGELPAAALAVLKAGPALGAQVGFGSLPAAGGDGPPLAIGRVAVSPAPDGTRWVGLTAVEVAPASRGDGLGRAMVQGLLAWAHARGATRCYLQVAADNEVALRFYDRLGFAEHHRYHYRHHPGA